MSSRLERIAHPMGAAAIVVAIWQCATWLRPVGLIPGPGTVFAGLLGLAQQGVLAKHVVASLFRVTWGYLLAAMIAIPFGLFVGSQRRLRLAIAPVLRIVRPISPLAWIPIAILWFGLDDRAPIFLIFLGAFFPLAESSMHAVSHVPRVYLLVGKNFGLSRLELLRQVILPAALPQILVALRVALGIAWLVLVAAEMIAVSSGLGFLIVDARNAGNRYDLVIAGMAIIGVIGLSLDRAIRRLERVETLRWAFVKL
jgi:NitT/TauT family transport system permease protein